MHLKRTLTNGTLGLAAALTLSVGLHGQTLNTIYTLGKGTGDGPVGPLVIGPGGGIYGTTSHGGASGLGAAYELVPPASPGGAWTAAVLHSFSPQSGDGQASAGLSMGPSGVLYGVTSGYGTVFQLKSPGGANAQWRETVLHAFSDTNGDGANPAALPVFGPHKTLYGTTLLGGINSGGTVYRLAPPTVPGNPWTEQILYSFPEYPTDGEQPTGPLVVGGNGAVYGVTESGGGGAVPGTVFQLAPPTSQGGIWTETTLYAFGTQSGDWGLPNGLVPGPNGVLYGTAMGSTGTQACFNGCGTVFQLTPPASPGGAWTETILHSFTGTASGDGSNPNSVPVIGPGGVLYGTTSGGGANFAGTIYEMLPPSSPGGGWTEVTLYSFTGTAGQWIPVAVALGPDGNLYGTTSVLPAKNGASKPGTVFQLVLK